VFSGFVDISLGTRRRARADDAITATALDMHDGENSVAQRGSNDDHPVGPGAIVKVHSSRVSEDGGCFWEGNPVHFEILTSLLVIPLEIAFDDCSHSMHEYGLYPIRGQAAPGAAPVGCYPMRRDSPTDRGVSIVRASLVGAAASRRVPASCSPATTGAPALSMESVAHAGKIMLTRTEAQREATAGSCTTHVPSATDRRQPAAGAARGTRLRGSRCGVAR
jgi:hypothetical protein